MTLVSAAPLEIGLTGVLDLATAGWHSLAAGKISSQSLLTGNALCGLGTHLPC